MNNSLKLLIFTVLQEMRETFDDEAASTGLKKLILSVAVGVAEKHVTLAYNVPQLARWRINWKFGASVKIMYGMEYLRLIVPH